MRARLIWKRTALTFLFVIAVLLGAVGITVLGWVFYPPLRTSALQRGLAEADRSLPGKFSHSEVRSSHSGGVQIRNFRWVGDGDVLLLKADALLLDLDVDALVRRKIRVRTLRADSLDFDLPAIQEALASASSERGETPKPKPKTGEGTGVPFLDPGVLPGVPSIVVDELALSLSRGRISETLTLRGFLDLTADLSTAGGGALGLNADIRGDKETDPRLVSDLNLHLVDGTADGELEVALDEDWKALLQLSSPRPRVIAARLNDWVSSETGLDLNLDVEIERATLTELTAVSFGGVFEIPELEVLRTRPPLRDLPELPLKSRTKGRLDGRIDLAGTPSYQAELSLGANELWNGVRVDGRFQDGRWEIRKGRVEATGLQVDISGTGDPETMDVGVQAWVDSLAFLEPWMTSPLESSAVEVSAQARLAGAPNRLGLALSLSGSGNISGAELDDVRLRVDTDALGETPLDLLAGVVSLDLQTDLRAQLSADSQSLRMAPVRVLSRPGARRILGVPGLEAGVPMSGPLQRATYPALAGGEGSAKITWSSGVVVEDLQLIGDLGRLGADASVSEDGDLAATFDARWPRAPKVLVDRLGLRPGLADTLAQAWTRDGPFAVTGAVRGSGESMSGQLRLEVPGPHTLAALLPDSVSTEGLGSLQGTAAFQRSGENLSLDAFLEGEAWLDSLHADASQIGSEWTIDELDLSLLGLGLDGSGNWGTTNDLQFALRVPNLEGLRVVLPKQMEGLSASLDGTVLVGGSAQNPELDLSLTGQTSREAEAGGQPLEVELWTLRAQRDSSMLRADLELPKGVVGLPLVVSSAELSLGSESSTGFPLDVAFRAEGPELGASADLYVERADSSSWRIRGDKLEASVRSRTLSSREVFRLFLDPTAQRYQVDDFRLEGDIGSLSLDGVLQPMDSDLEASADLRLPERPKEVDLPDWAWAERVRLDLRAQGTSGLDLDLVLEGVPWDETPLDAAARVQTEAEGVVLTASVTQEGDSLLTARGVAPGYVQILPARIEGGDGPVELQVDVREFPVPVPARDRKKPEEMILSGRLRADGLASGPRFRGEFGATFPDWPEMSHLKATASTRYTSESGTADLRLAALKRNGSETFTDSLIVGTARVPVALSLYPISVEMPDDAEIAARLFADRFDLQEFEPLLPSDFSVRGQAAFSMELDGPLDDPKVKGSVQATQAEARLADGSRVAASSKLNLSGSLRRPRLTGRVDVASGLLVVPETKKDLLPAEGRSRLLELRRNEPVVGIGPANVGPGPIGVAEVDSAAVGALTKLETVRSNSGGSVVADSVGVRLPGSEALPADSVVVTPGLATGRTEQSAEDTEIVPELDVTIDIPGAVWIRGRGLEVELEGTLRATYEEAPVLTGTLEARSGYFRLLGRFFEIQSGVVGFYGEPEIDPDLDLVLQTRVDATQVFVEVTGTALSPQLRLRSDPEMEEGDILSVLLLGRPLDQLDDDQVDLLESRAADVAAGFGATQLGERLSGQLGVDLVSVQQGSQPNSGNALVIGKYLSPRILLKYEQALQSSADFLVNLEYLLSRHLRLETFYGPRSQSGVEFNWISEY